LAHSPAASSFELKRGLRLRNIRHVRAFVVRGCGADYHDRAGGHWIDDHLSTPMAKYPQYRRQQRHSVVARSAALASA
jgi:hypothetical protein